MQLTRKFFLQRDQAGTEKCDGSQFLASRFLIFLLGSEQKSFEKSVANMSGKKMLEKSKRKRFGRIFAIEVRTRSLGDVVQRKSPTFEMT